MKKRYHLIEIHEQTWCPAVIRNSVTDYLQCAITTGDAYRPIFQKLKDAVQITRSTKVIDLCSGGGGPWVNFKKDFAQTEIILTDLFPNHGAFQELKASHDLSYNADSVNVLDVPEKLQDFAQCFLHFIIFRRANAQQILRDAVEKNCGIGVFEATPRNSKTLLLMLFTPLMALFLTLKIKPFKLSRIIFTYLLPIIPFVIGFDGVVSVLRTYKPEDLLKMAAEIEAENYIWESGTNQGENTPIPVVYLIGYPKPEAKKLS